MVKDRHGARVEGGFLKSRPSVSSGPNRNPPRPDKKPGYGQIIRGQNNSSRVKCSICKQNVPAKKPWVYDLDGNLVHKNCYDKKQKKLKEASKRRENIKKFQLGEFMKLLKDLRECNKISAEELRDYRKIWENYPQNRKILTDDLATKRTK